MRIQCGGCNKTLNVPDDYAGKKVKCPVCDRTIVVPQEAAEGDEAELEIKDTWEGEEESEAEAEEKPAPASRRRRLRKLSSGRKAEARKELAQLKQHRGRSAPPPVEPGSADHCPSCNAPLMGGAVVCTFCGYDLRAGRKVLGPREAVWPKISGLLGPITALIVVVVGGYYVYDKWLAGKPREKKAPPPVQQPVPDDTTTPAGVVKPPASSFKGGETPRETFLADTSAPYRLEKDVRVGPGGTLRIGPGVRIEGAGGIVGAGTLLTQGSDSSPVRLAVPVRLDKADTERPRLEADGTLFLAPVQLRSPSAVRVEGCVFKAGLTLELETLRSGRVDVEVTATRIAGADPVLALKVPGHAKQMLLRINGCDIMGKVSGTIGSFSALDLSDNYWSLSDTEALSELRGEGDVLTKPVRPEPAVGEISDEAAGAASSFRLEKPSVSLPVPGGWQAGEKHSVWRETAKGSIVVSLVEERIPQNGLEVFLQHQVQRLYAVDRDASGKAAEPPIVDAAGYTDHIVDLYWHEAPHRIVYHVTTVKNKVLGVKISLPAGLWEENKDELTRLMAAVEVKGG